MVCAFACLSHGSLIRGARILTLADECWLSEQWDFPALNFTASSIKVSSYCYKQLSNSGTTPIRYQLNSRQLIMLKYLGTFRGRFWQIWKVPALE